MAHGSLSLIGKSTRAGREDFGGEVKNNGRRAIVSLAPILHVDGLGACDAAGRPPPAPEPPAVNRARWPAGADATSDEVPVTGRVFRGARDITDALIEYRWRHPQPREFHPVQPGPPPPGPK